MVEFLIHLTALLPSRNVSWWSSRFRGLSRSVKASWDCKASFPHVPNVSYRIASLPRQPKA
jgi:hypothetical protein